MSLQSPRQDLPFVDPNRVLHPYALELLQEIINTLNGKKTAVNFIEFELAGVKFTIGNGSPNTVVSGSPPDIYFNLSGGAATTFWVKETGVGTNTGWVGK